jgi:hypothetical protein
VRAEQSRAEQSMGTDKRDLVMLATEIADSLIATALRRRLSDALAAATDELTRSAVSARRPLALPPAPEAKRRGRKPGPKPGRRAKKPESAVPSPEPVHRRPGRPEKNAAPVAASPAAPDVDLAVRRCRNCKKIGTAERVAGTDREVRCTSCRATWKTRVKASEGGGASPRPKHPRAESNVGDCRRCDHGSDQHEAGDGRCLVPRCSCGEFYE